MQLYQLLASESELILIEKVNKKINKNIIELSRKINLEVE